MRSDVHYRLLKEESAISPVILNHRVGDTSDHIGLVKRLIQEMYAENPPWLDMAHNLLPGLLADK